MADTLWQQSIQAMMVDRLPNPGGLSENVPEIATTKAFGEALVKLGAKYKNIVVLDAVSNKLLHTAAFAQTFPDRYFTFGNAEQNMVSAAAGFTVRGKIPFVCNFSLLLTGRSFEQIRNAVCYPHLNIKFIGSHAGLFGSEESSVYQALEDMAIMRTLPNMKVFSPADGMETKKMVELMMNDFGPTYMRLTSTPLPNLYHENEEFALGKAHVYKPGTDVCMFATGVMVHSALQASEILEREGISTMVVNVSSLKPIDENLIVECAKQAHQIVTLEDHQIIGGLGSAVMEVLGTHYPMKVLRIGMDGFGESGKSDDLYRKYGLDPVSVAEKIKSSQLAMRNFEK